MTRRFAPSIPCTKMRILVTGSAGHLGEALVRTLTQLGHEPTGIDLKASPFTRRVGSITDREFVTRCLRDVDAVIHAAALHKPHVATHSRQDFVDTNITGTLNLLEESVSSAVRIFVFTSTTSAFGSALVPASNSAPAAWITEDVAPRPKNIYGVTKVAAEDLCELFHRKFRLPCLILRTSRFFPEPDDRMEIREAYADLNLKTNEFLYRRVDIEDVVDAHVRALQNGSAIGFGRYIISATTPFTPEDLAELRTDAPSVVGRHVSRYREVYRKRGWSMFPGIDRVYVNERARCELGWQPKYDFERILDRIEAHGTASSPLAEIVGVKGYHAQVFLDGPYPVE
jgi:UDP-glucose 4-epimerase